MLCGPANGSPCNPPWRSLQSEVLAQCPAFVRAEEQAAAPQLGHDETREALKPGWDHRRGDHEAVAAFGFVPSLHDVGDLVGDSGINDEAYYSALVRMFEQGLTVATEFPAADRNEMLERLAVRRTLRGLGWGVSDALNVIWHDRVD